MNALKNRKYFSTLLIFCLAFGLTACTHSSGTNDEFLTSGSIILSHQIDSVEKRDQIASAEITPEGTLHAPLIGYIPPLVGFLPAENEAWLEIDTQSKSLIVYRGKELVKSVPVEGVIGLKAGVYALQHKQKKAAWYAPDAYFTKRGLPVPGSQDRSRFRKGALGQYVLYPTTKFAIHSAPVWSDEVGGLRIAKADMSSIYFMLPIGATVVVK